MEVSYGFSLITNAAKICTYSLVIPYQNKQKPTHQLHVYKEPLYSTVSIEMQALFCIPEWIAVYYKRSRNGADSYTRSLQRCMVATTVTLQV